MSSKREESDIKNMKISKLENFPRYQLLQHSKLLDYCVFGERDLFVELFWGKR